jgi:hypothetical protein
MIDVLDCRFWDLYGMTTWQANEALGNHRHLNCFDSLQLVFDEVP